MNDIKNDTNLREAVSRREQQLPPMPADLNERVIKSLKEQKAVSKKLRLWPFAVAACVAGLVAFFLVPPRTVEDEQQLALEKPIVTEQPPIVKEEPVEAKVEVETETLPVKPKKAPKRKRVVQPEPVEKPLLAEAEPVQEEPEQEDVYQPKQPDPYLLAVAEAQDIRSRGEHLYQEVNQILINAKIIE